MKIDELAGNLHKNVTLTVEVVDIEEPKEVKSKFGKKLTLNNVIVKDETGEVKLVLWNDQINEVKVGERIILQDVYVKEFNGELQLTLGKSGKILHQ